MTHGPVFSLMFSLSLLIFAMIFSGESSNPERDLRGFRSGVVIMAAFLAIEAMIRVVGGAP